MVAAALVGALAERRQDRSLLTALPAALAGTAVIYACGAAWLAHSLGVAADEAITLGVTPFLLGDAAKIVVAGVGLPLAWRLAGDR